MELHTYLKQNGWGTATRLARAIGAPVSDVVQWGKKNRPVPPARCQRIETATAGAVTRKELRPSDWADYWPELAEQPATTN